MNTDPKSASAARGNAGGGGAVSQALGKTAGPTSILGIIAGLGFWVIGGFIYVALQPWGPALIQKWWWIVALGVAALVVVASWRGFQATAKIAVVVFAILPVTLASMAVGLQRKPELTLRVVFLLGVCLLPALMNYLFSVTRKGTLVHQFINNLERLGLVGTVGGQPEVVRSIENRAYAYGEKFKALYGTVSPETLQAFLGYAQPVVQALSPKTHDPTSRRLQEVFPLENAIPMILATIMVALGWFLALPPTRPAQVGEVPALLRLLGPLAPEDNPVNFAFLGAYFFSVQMLFRRYVRMDLRGSAYLSIAIRIIVAVIGTWAAVSLFTYTGETVEGEHLLVLGFGIGIFPPIVWQFVSTWFKDKAGATFPALQTQLPLHDLDGLTIWYQERLVEEDIENIPNMATADIVDLMLRTTIPADRIIDWVDQSILYTHLGVDDDDKSVDARRKLREHGIRSASDLVDGLRNYPNLESLLNKDNESPSRIRSIANAVWTNPNLPMIMRWRGLHQGWFLAELAWTAPIGATPLQPLSPSPTLSPPIQPAAVTTSPSDQKANGAPVG